MTLAPTTLSYADTPFRWGITVEHRADGVVLTVPPVPSWRQLSLHYLWGIYPLASAAIAFFAVFHGGPELLTVALLNGAIVLAIVVHAIGSLRSRKIITVASAYVCVRTTGLRKDIVVVWPREKIYGVKRNTYTGKLLFHITGEQMPEIAISKNQQVTEWVAETISDAIFKTSPDPLTLRAGVPSELADKPPADPAAIKIRWIAAFGLIAILTAFGITEIFIMKQANAGVGLLTLAVFLTIIACGSIFGTQKKDFWV